MRSFLAGFLSVNALKNDIICNEGMQSISTAFWGCNGLFSQILRRKIGVRLIGGAGFFRVDEKPALLVHSSDWFCKGVGLAEYTCG
jgi:hypothetical protein